jgi:amino acid adenylation domain-containing protein
MLADATPVVVLTQERLRGRLPAVQSTLITVDAQNAAKPEAPRDEQRDAQGHSWQEFKRDERQDASNPVIPGLTPRNLAYVLYTSGSTGTPKGVMVEHRNIANYSRYAAERFDVAQGAGSLICTSLNFDLTLTSFYPPLLSGRTVRLCEEGQDLQELARSLLASENLAPLKLTPSHLQALQQVLPAEQLAGRVRTLVLGGEPIAPHVVEHWMRYAPATRVFNHYGPTETTVGCVVYEIESSPTGPVPIGRPIANVRIYILDERQRPVAIGVTGELYIAGAGVARGYLNRPALTAERFVRDPFSTDAQARMYKTGDVGRWRADGNIEFLGRNDTQVKIRGFRIELGEIEAQLLRQGQIQEAAVIAREDTPGEKRLVAYYTSAAETLSVDVLREHAKASLPDYMLPSAYVRLESLPLTPNGKLDRKALPAPDATALALQQYEAPQGEIETALAGIWQELLAVQRVGRRDNFFELGGHSLLAVQMLTRIRAVLGRELAMRDLFEAPTLQAVALSLSGRVSAALQPVERADREQALPLSHAQQRLWFVDQLEGAGSAYHIAGGLKLLGSLDKRALQFALDTIVQRHEVLRTVFTQINGNPIQVIAASATFALREVDLSAETQPARDAALKQHAAAEVSERFDLSAGPLIRARLLRFNEQEHVLLLTMHHIVSDGWSIGLLIKELRTLYAAYREGRANPLPPLPIQYADYAVWQRQWLQGGVSQTQLSYWKQQLAGAPALLELPTDRPRPSVQDFRGGSVLVALDAELTDRLNAFSRSRDVTLFMTLYAGFAILLSRLSGQSDLVIGSPLANRQRMEVEPLIGFFVNTLPLRIQMSDDPTVSGLLQRVKAMTLAAYSHQDIPFEQIVEEIQPPRTLSHSPIYQVSLTWGNTPQSELSLPGLTLARIEVPHDTSQIDLSLIIREEGGRIIGNVNYAGGLFDRSTVERWMQHFTTVLVGMLEDAERPVTRVPLLDQTELSHVIRELNATAAPYRKDALIHELVEAHALSHPQSIAVTFEGLHLTYEELNRRGNQLAHYLRARGVRPGTLVGICIERGVHMVIGLLGILKAGAAYVPLDPSYPEDRLAYILDDTAAPIVLTSESIEPLLPVTSAYVIRVDAQWAEIAKRAGTNLHRGENGLAPDNLAYVIYTSGSTGRPKGVMVEHRHLVNLIDWHCAAFEFKAGQRSTSVAGFGFDAAVWEMWTALCAGAELVLPSPTIASDVESLLRWWEEQKIDVSFLPTPMAEFAFNRGIDNSGLRVLLVGGDQLLNRPERAKAYRLINNYGLTETTVVATSGFIDVTERTAHIGRPISNTQIYILDAHGQPVPIGVVGELFIGGASVARGYLNRDELTKERFVRDPFSADPEARMYKTGDLGRWRADGNIEFIGRNDSQVKIRGYRVELGEIEWQLSNHPHVKEAVVVVQESQPGEKHLVAYVTYAEKPPSVEDLRAYLKATLPTHMIPTAFVPLESLPLTPNGKVDRHALPEPELNAFALKQFEPPQGEIEGALAGIWQELLRIDRVGRHDSFFDLGGHSLLAVQAIARIRQNLEAEISLAKLFEAPSVAALADVVYSTRLAQFDPDDVARISATLTASSSI